MRRSVTKLKNGRYRVILTNKEMVVLCERLTNIKSKHVQSARFKFCQAEGMARKAISGEDY